MIPIATRIAVRSLGRNPRRTALSVAGIGIGCAMAVLITSLMRGNSTLYARAAAESGAGHLRIAPQGWLVRHDPDLRLREGEALLAMARSLPGVAVATPRSRVQALLAMGSHVVGVEVVGVDPATEPASYRFVRRVVHGRYLEPNESGTVVIGRALAERLEVEVDDELVVTAVGVGGAMQSAMARVVGIVSAGSREIDSQTCQVPLPDVAHLSGREGIGEIAVLLRDQRQIESARAALAARLPAGDEVLTWAQVTPELATHLRQDAGLTRILSGIVIFLVLLGVASAQLTAVLERRRELAVLAALGMRPAQLARQLILETLAQGLLGAALALAIAGPLVWRFATAGIDISGLLKGDLTFQGLLMEPRVYTELGPWMVPYAAGLALAATALASLYPAWFAARAEPAAALRVAQ